MNSTAEIVTKQWFVLDDRGFLHDCRDEEEARFDAGKVGHEMWTVHWREVRTGPLVDEGTMW